MKLKNYTTDVPVSRSIAEIETFLSQNGASAIMKEYMGDGRVISITFQLANKVGYKLPANVERVYSVLKAEKKSNSRVKLTMEQAERVAWRVLRDWLYSQLSLIAIGQAEFDQVMLPYAFDGKQTLYERIKSSEDLRGKLLGGPSD
jgi:hypothetical protein